MQNQFVPLAAQPTRRLFPFSPLPQIERQNSEGSTPCLDVAIPGRGLTAYFGRSNGGIYLIPFSDMLRVLWILQNPSY